LFQNKFKKWYKKNSYFFNQPFASKKIDSTIHKKSIQRVLKKSSVFGFYVYSESKIVKDYTQLIDMKLREAINLLSVEDFKKTSEFSGEGNNNILLKNYFKTRDMLLLFIAKDIYQHQHELSRIHAFCRWIDVADLLLKNGCYEGFHMVTLRLKQLETETLNNSLDKPHKRLFETFVNLCRRPDGLNSRIELDERSCSLPPLIHWFMQLTGIKGEIGNCDSDRQDKEQLQKLNALKTKKKACYRSIMLHLKHLKNYLKKSKKNSLPTHLEKMWKKLERVIQNEEQHNRYFVKNPAYVQSKQSVKHAHSKLSFLNRKEIGLKSTYLKKHKQVYQKGLSEISTHTVIPR